MARQSKRKLDPGGGFVPPLDTLAEWVDPELIDRLRAVDKNFDPCSQQLPDPLLKHPIWGVLLEQRELVWLTAIQFVAPNGDSYSLTLNRCEFVESTEDSLAAVGTSLAKLFIVGAVAPGHLEYFDAKSAEQKVARSAAEKLFHDRRNRLCWIRESVKSEPGFSQDLMSLVDRECAAVESSLDQEVAVGEDYTEHARFSDWCAAGRYPNATKSPYSKDHASAAVRGFTLSVWDEIVLANHVLSNYEVDWLSYCVTHICFPRYRSDFPFLPDKERIADQVKSLRRSIKHPSTFHPNPPRDWSKLPRSAVLQFRLGLVPTTPDQ